MTCPFCGLETGSPTSHETQEACIEALRSQVSELRTVLEHTRQPGDPAVLSKSGLGDTAALAGAENGKGA